MSPVSLPECVCWGSDAFCELGIGCSLNDRYSPVSVLGLKRGIIAMGLGLYRSCAVLDSGAMKCWGDNMFGALGNNPALDYSSPLFRSAAYPESVVGLDRGVTAIATGFAHTCAVVGGAAKCWGDNFYGEVGDGTSFAVRVPQPVLLGTIRMLLRDGFE